MRGSLRPLRIPAFGHLALAYLVNELGNWMGEIALAILVFEATGSPIATAALFIAMQFVPALATPPLVARLEPARARRALPALYVGEAAAFALLALLADDFTLAPVLALAAFDGALAGSARALTRASAAAALAPEGMLRQGNALLNIGFTAGAAGGPALAGIVVGTAGVQAALLVDAASFLAVALLLASARSLPDPAREGGGFMLRLRRGFGYVRERLVLRRLLAAQAAAFVFFSLVIPIEVVFAKETLDAGNLGYSALLTAWGGGMVVGSFLFTALSRVALTILLALSTLAIGGAYLGMAAAPTLAVACAASAVGGIGNGIQWVALITAIQELTAAAYQARVVALLESIASAMPGIGFLVGGAIAALLSPRASFAVAGAGVMVVLMLAIVALRRASWRPEFDAFADESKLPPTLPVGQIRTHGTPG
jgi:MFS family permease